MVLDGMHKSRHWIREISESLAGLRNSSHLPAPNRQAIQFERVLALCDQLRGLWNFFREIGRTTYDASSSVRNEWLNIVELLNATIETTKSAGPIEISMEAPAEGLFLCFHRGLLSVIFGNILFNAFIATRNVAEPKLAIIARSLTRDRGEIWLSITFEDNGPGVPEVVRQFLVAGEKHKSIAAEIGLGLPMARDIAMSYGGDLCVCAPQKCTGAKFLLELPVRSRRGR
jgi:signal transduction histidine kinase